MFVCPVPKISQVMMKWRRRASHLGRFTLWHNGRRATQLGRFTLWHNGRWNFWKTNALEFCKHRSIIDLQQTSKLLKYVRFTKIQQTFERLTLYEDRNADRRAQQTFERLTPRTHEITRTTMWVRASKWGKT